MDLDPGWQGSSRSPAAQVWPELCSGRRNARKFAAHVHVPEASMDKDDGSESWQDDIWLARQVLAMKSEPVALRVQCFANQDFRFCVSSLNARHHPAAYCIGNDVGHFYQEL